MSAFKFFNRLQAISLKITCSFIAILFGSCSSKEPRVPVKELGFEVYMHKALNVDFEFGYQLIKYELRKNDDRGFTKIFIIQVAQRDLEK